MRTRLTAALLVAATLAAGAAAVQADSTAPATITRSRVGAVELHATYQSLRRRHLVGKIRPGCELGGPSTRSAPLRAPARGSVDFTLHSPRKVANITVFGGAEARGVGIGATLEEITAHFPAAEADHSTDATFGYTSVRVPKGEGGRLEFALDTQTHVVTAIGIPFVAACE